MYIVVENKQVSGDKGIVNEVNTKVMEGFIPVGGLMFNNTYYYQALFRHAKPAVKPIAPPIAPPHWKEINILSAVVMSMAFGGMRVRYEFRGTGYEFETEKHTKDEIELKMICLEDWATR